MTENEAILRAIARHGTPTPHSHTWGKPCLCWQDAQRVVNDLQQAGYVIVKMEQPAPLGPECDDQVSST